MEIYKIFSNCTKHSYYLNVINFVRVHTVLKHCIMTLISKEIEIQDKISTVFEALINQKERIRRQLRKTRHSYDAICDKHIHSGFKTEAEWLEASNKHYIKYQEYDTYCCLTEIITDYRSVEGIFPEYLDMLQNLENIMLKYAAEERYEVAAILKNWLDKLTESIQRY